MGRHLKFSLSLLFILFWGDLRLFADVATEGEINRLIRIENLKDFPEYDFFIRYQTYRYEEGYQPNGFIDIFLSPDSNYVTGSRYDKSLLFALKKGSGEEFKSEEEIGGSVIERNYSIQAYEDVYKVTKMENGKIELKLIRTEKLKRGGKKDELIPGSGYSKWETLGMFLLPLACLASLVMFFIFRKKKSSPSVAV